MDNIPRPVWWIVGGIAAIALLSIWIVDRSPLDDSFKDTARRTITTGAALSVVGLLAGLALLGLPTPFGLVAAASIFIGTGAYAVTQKALTGALSEPVCPEGCGTSIVDGRLWCYCQTEDGTVEIFPADGQAG